MARVTFNAENLGDHLKPFAMLTVNFKANGTANLRQLSGQVNQSSFRPNIFCCALSYNMTTRWFVPFRFDFQTRQVAGARTILKLHVPGHSSPPYKQLGVYGFNQVIFHISFEIFQLSFFESSFAKVSQ
jgi:hypothetical protein